MRVFGFVLALVLLAASGPALAIESNPLQSYYGVWAAEPVGDVNNINLKINKTKNGFAVSWKPLGADERKSKMVTLTFVSKDDGQSYQLSDGTAAKNTKATVEIADGKLIISLTEIDPGGKEIVSRYERSVSGNRLTLTYTRSRNGEVLRSTTETMVRFQL